LRFSPFVGFNSLYSCSALLTQPEASIVEREIYETKSNNQIIFLYFLLPLSIHDKNTILSTLCNGEIWRANMREFKGLYGETLRGPFRFAIDATTVKSKMLFDVSRRQHFFSNVTRMNATWELGINFY
jgi:hypothetical protein